MSDREEKIRKNREKFPAVARMTDEIRAEFPRAKLLGAIEGGVEVGAVTDNLRKQYAGRKGEKT